MGEEGRERGLLWGKGRGFLAERAGLSGEGEGLAGEGEGLAGGGGGA